MKKGILLSAIFSLLLTYQLVAQTSMTDVIRTEAKVYATATFSGDAETMFQYTYPKMVELIGGKTSFIAQFKMNIEGLKTSNILLKSINCGDPGPIFKAGNELHAIIPQLQVVENDEYVMKTKEYLLAISTNGGKSWYFLNLTGFDNQTIKYYFPDFNDQLEIPQKLDPEFEYKNK
jgi:hypothetical protein